MTEDLSGVVTSFAGLFRPGHDATSAIAGIEIPRIQRDYAQGRSDPLVKEIRGNFVAALHAALVDDKPLSLDFVYGEIDAARKFRPLDGQQRLTTLFLLHWYLANRADTLDEEPGWKQFSYATRDGVALFCERLASSKSVLDGGALSTWIIDQAWFQYLWRHDPTIKSMLVMIDAIHAAFAEDDAVTCVAAWRRLVDPMKPAVSFNRLLLSDFRRGAELYIKMNSRGKPLTDFETFKARLERAVEWNDERKHKLAHKIDTVWSDLLWKISRDAIVDDEFMNYIGYVVELCEWSENRTDPGPIGPRSERLFAEFNADSARHFRLLFHAFDTWLDAERHPIDVDAAFVEYFAAEVDSQTAASSGKVVLHGRDDVNLFRAACHEYGQMRSKARVFTLGESLLLYAVLLHRDAATDTPDFARRLRVLRNLIAASVDELRPESGPSLLSDVRELIVHGNLDGVTRLNRGQVNHEKVKGDFLAQHPDLEAAVFRLEDHSLLRGRLAVFTLDAEVFERRALTFEKLMAESRSWPLVTGALLTKGDYGRNMRNNYLRRGSPSIAGYWRDLLTEGTDAEAAQTAQTLGTLLDHVASADGDMAAVLGTLRDEWLAQVAAERLFDWRYYLVRYDAMREGKTGYYFSGNATMGYDLCMLWTESRTGYYHDPYLLAAWRELGSPKTVAEPRFRYAQERWMALPSQCEIRAINSGFEIRPPDDEEVATRLAAVQADRADTRHVEGSYFVDVPQRNDRGVLVDTEDRVQIGVSLVRDLLDAGL